MKNVNGRFVCEKRKTKEYLIYHPLRSAKEIKEIKEFKRIHNILRNDGEDSITDAEFDWYEARFDRMKEHLTNTEEKEEKEEKEEAPKEATEYEKITNKLNEAIRKLPILGSIQNVKSHNRIWIIVDNDGNLYKGSFQQLASIRRKIGSTIKRASDVTKSGRVDVKNKLGSMFMLPKDTLAEVLKVDANKVSTLDDETFLGKLNRELNVLYGESKKLDKKS